MKSFYTLLAFLLPLPGVAQKNSDQLNQEICLASTLIDGRFYLKIPTVNGDTILGFCDTGGGYTAIHAATIKMLNLETKVRAVEISGEQVKYIPASDIIAHADIPQPHIGNYYGIILSAGLPPLMQTDK